MEKENPYQATQRLINYPSPPGWTGKIVISYVHKQEEETAGAWDGVVLEVRGSVLREKQLVTLRYGPAE